MFMPFRPNKSVYASLSGSMTNIHFEFKCSQSSSSICKKETIDKLTDLSSMTTTLTSKFEFGLKSWAEDQSHKRLNEQSSRQVTKRRLSEDWVKIE